MWWRINKWLFLILLLILGITNFTRNNYRGVDDISPALYKEPVQIEDVSDQDFQFKIGDFDYRLEPLYLYEISGMIVSKKDYSWLSIYKRNRALPVDLCLIWGGNVASKVYQSRDLKFAQDIRFCSARWKYGLSFDMNKLSNNHLLIANDIVNKKAKDLTRGDQVKILGRLVNVYAVNRDKEGKYDPSYFELKSSTTRTDTGAGACEVIYVEDIEILKKANPISKFLFKGAIYGILGLIIVNIVRFFI